MNLSAISILNETNYFSNLLIKHINWLILPTFIFVIIATVFSNIFIILSVVFNRKMHNYVNYQFVSSAFADLLVGTVIMPSLLLSILYGYWPLSVEFCIIWCVSDSFVCNVSSLSLLLISIHRLKCIISPTVALRDEKFSKTISLPILVTWFIPLVYWIISIFSFMSISHLMNKFDDKRQCDFEFPLEFDIISSILFDFLPVIGIFILQIWIYFALKSKSRKIAALEGTRTCTTGNFGAYKVHKSRKDQKANRALFLISFSSLSLGLPWFIIELIEAKCSCVDKWIYNASILMLYLNSLVKPIQIITGQEMFKDTLVIFFKSIKKFLLIPFKIPSNF